MGRAEKNAKSLRGRYVTGKTIESPPFQRRQVDRGKDWKSSAKGGCRMVIAFVVGVKSEGKKKNDEPPVRKT